MKRIRIDLSRCERLTCPSCAAPIWVTPDGIPLHRVPTCRWFDARVRVKPTGDGGTADRSERTA
jgi:hypothetical protein